MNSPAQHPEIENFNRVLRRNHPWHVPVEGVSRGAYYVGSWATDHRPDPAVKCWRDDWGVGWTDLEGEVFPTNPTVSSYEEIDQVPQPDPNRPGGMKTVEKLASAPDRQDFCLAVCHPYFLYEKAINILGPEEFGVSLLAGPEYAHRLLDRILEFQLVIARQYVRYRPEHVNLSDDYGHQDRLAMSPECWRKFIKSRLAAVVSFYRRELGPQAVISLHCCGHVMPIVEDLMEIGFDVLHPVQSRSNDLAALRRLTSGRLTLAGGIDGQQVLPFGTPAQVRAEVFAKLDLLWEGGGYLPMPEKTLGVSTENLQAVNAAIREWSRQHVER